MVTHAVGAEQAIADEAGRLRTPWWYRYVRSWRWRMWLETGVWVPQPYVAATDSVIATAPPAAAEAPPAGAMHEAA